jgi:hypothetical protein
MKRSLGDEKFKKKLWSENVIYASVQISNIFVFIICFGLINLSFRYSFFLFLKFLLVSRLKFFRLSPK